MARILIIDESESHIEIIREALTKYSDSYISDWKLNLHVAKTANYAQQLLQYHNYEMVIMEVSLAKVDGWELLKLVRNKFPQLKVPVVILSPVHAIELEYQAMRHGASLWLVKFPTLQILAKEIYQLLQGA